MLGTLLLLVLGVTWSWAVDYELLLEDPDIMSRCTNGPPGAITAREAFNFDNISIDMDSDTIHVSGNSSCRWEVEPTDRIASRIEIYHFNRGNWEPTVFNVGTPDFCAVMFDKNYFYYKHWTRYISNHREVEKQCFSPGTVWVHDPFDVRMKLNNYRGPKLQGRYKSVVTWQAFDKNNVPRPTSICMEFRGEFLKTQ